MRIPHQTNQPLVSFVLATRNRHQIVRRTLERIASCGLERPDFEIIVVDNASTDGTPEELPAICNTYVRLVRDRGSCAKAIGVAHANGGYVVFLDDDSFPRSGAIDRMLDHFEADDRLGAAGFTVHSSDGSREGGALPDLFVRSAVGLRTEALRACGGLDLSFFTQAEETDLAFRLAMSGWNVRVFDDMHVNRRKTPSEARSEQETFYDIRNNLRVIDRYMPQRCHEAYRQDRLLRSRWLAETAGHGAAFARGVKAGQTLAANERRTHRRCRLSHEVFERFFRWDDLSTAMNELRRSGTRRVVFADFGENILAYYQAAQGAGINVAAIGDDRFSVPGRKYRGLPILPWEAAADLDADGIIVANSSPAHGTATWRRVFSSVSIPVLHWFRPAGDVTTSDEPFRPNHARCRSARVATVL